MEWALKWGMEFNVGKCKCMKLGKLSKAVEYNRYIMGGKELEITKEERDLGVITTDNFKSSQQCNTAAKKANRVLGMIRRVINTRSAKVLLPLYKALVRPHLEYAVQAWSPHLVKDIEILERVQHRFTRMVEGLKELEYKQRLEYLGLPSLRFRRLRGDLIETFKILKGNERVKSEKFFTLSHNTKTRGHSLKLCTGKSRIDNRKYSFSSRVVRDWNELPEEVICSNTINKFKKRIDVYFSKVGALYEC